MLKIKDKMLVLNSFQEEKLLDVIFIVLYFSFLLAVVIAFILFDPGYPVHFIKYQL